MRRITEGRDWWHGSRYYIDFQCNVQPMASVTARSEYMEIISSQAGTSFAPGHNSRETVPSEPPERLKSVLVGLPCACCKVYYDAGADACPVCGCKERL